MEEIKGVDREKTTEKKSNNQLSVLPIFGQPFGSFVNHFIVENVGNGAEIDQLLNQREGIVDIA